jgi:hypothetical protein
MAQPAPTARQCTAALTGVTAEDATTLQRARQPGPAATVTHGTSRTLLDGGAQSVGGVG